MTSPSPRAIRPKDAEYFPRVDSLFCCGTTSEMKSVCARTFLARFWWPVIAMAVALISCLATACAGHICAVTIRAASGSAVLGASYPDTCLRSGDGAVDFDGQFWVPSPSASAAQTALRLCWQLRTGPSPQPAPPPATLTLVDGGHARWSDDASTYILVSAGRTERERPCG
jgi:hypothetical protein